jgi:drug/metabolite transporter (DMT)-like permease
MGLRLPRRLWPYAAVGGTIEVSGLIAFVVAARDDAAIAAVMSSQFAIVTVLGGYLLWGERIGRLQVVGVAVVLAGVATLTVLQA